MASKKYNLSKNEWRIMNVLWNSDHSLAVSEIVERLQGEVDWSYPTYTTQIDRLVKSGYLTFEKRGRSRFYSAAVDMESSVAEESKSIMDRIIPGASSQLLIAMLKETDRITPEDASELRGLIDELERRSSDD